MKDLEREKANKGPEKSANVAKLQKYQEFLLLAKNTK